jgi:insulysin
MPADRLEIQARDVQAFIPQLLSHLHIETLFHGNATKDDAIRLARIVEENLRAKSLDHSKIDVSRSSILPPGILIFNVF